MLGSHGGGVARKVGVGGYVDDTRDTLGVSVNMCYEGDGGGGGVTISGSFVSAKVTARCWARVLMNAALFAAMRAL